MELRGRSRFFLFGDESGVEDDCRCQGPKQERYEHGFVMQDDILGSSSQVFFVDQVHVTKYTIDHKGYAEHHGVILGEVGR